MAKLHFQRPLVFSVNYINIYADLVLKKHFSFCFFFFLLLVENGSAV